MTGKKDDRTESGPVRAFIAAGITDAIRDRLADVQERLKKTHAHVSWVPRESIHLSFAFLGELVPRRVSDVMAALDLAASKAAPFSFSVETIGFFGSRRAPRIIWAGVKCGEDLLRLQARITELLRAARMELETRPFRPHLTLGRVRSARGREALLDALDGVKSEPFGNETVAEVLLMRSVLHASGAEHSVLHRARLDNRPHPEQDRTLAC